jgi:FAD-linked oxidoreductase
MSDRTGQSQLGYNAAVSQPWVNWAGEQRCAPESVERPGSEEELAQAVGAAAAAGRKLRPVGSGHSFTDCACTDGCMVRLDRLDRLLELEPARGRVRAAAGIVLHELGARLAEHGLALENQGDIDRQTLAGAISTATHGTGASFRNLSAQVVGLRLVTAGGELLDLSEDSDPEAFRAARVAIGSLGVISRVTLQCVPLFTIRRIDAPRPLDETLERLDELAAEAAHWEFFLFPYTDVALTRTSERGDFPPEPEGAARRWLRETVVENRALDLFCRAGRAFPGALPTLQRTMAGLAGGSRKVDRSHRVYATKRSVRFTEMEYAIPRQHGAEAVRRVVELVRRRRLPANFPIEVRVVAGDDAFLSTAYGRDTCYVAVHQYQGMEFESYFRAVEAIMDEYDGRPHWGKRHYQSAATLAPRYPEWDRFQAVRARLDPEGAFENDYSRRVLGPVASAVAA